MTGSPRANRVLTVAAILLAAVIGQIVLSNRTRAEDDLPKPEQVFRYVAAAKGDAVVVTYTIAPHHYLYRSRMNFATDTAGVVLGDPQFPQGKIHDDENFGRQEVYYDQAVVTLPFVVTGARPSTLALTLKLQGCNEERGICYPPQKWLTNVALGSASASVDPLSFGKNRSPAMGDVLAADQAFQLSAEAAGPERIKLTWVIADGYYLYRSKIAVTTSSKQIALGTPAFPAGELIADDNFGEQEIYRGVLDVEVPFSRARAEGGSVDLDVTYQGCAEGRVCYPMSHKTVPVTIDASDGSASDAPVSEQDRLGKLISGPLGYALLAFFLAGLALSLTPCVLPMVPILAGIIGTQGKAVTTRRAFSLALVYVLGMALTYAAAGAIFAMAGKQAQAAFQQPWLITTFAALFVFLSLPMFGLFELQMPSFIQTRVASASNQQKAGTYIGTFVMGVLASLIVTTCVAPPLVGALGYIAQSGDVVRGASALFAMGIGMGVPLLVVGASAGKLLPRAGAWMVAVKSFFGVLFVGVAIYLLDRILPPVVTMVLWSVLVFATGYWLWSLGRAREGRAGNVVVAAVGLLLVLYGAILAVGAAAGNTDALQPLKSLAAGSAGAGGTRAPTAEDRFTKVKTAADLDARLRAAKAANRPVLVDFYADWCASCKEMEKYTFSDAAVIQAISVADLVRVDVTDDSALLERFGLVGPPTVLFFGRDGTERKGRRVVGYVEAGKFRELATQALAEGA